MKLTFFAPIMVIVSTISVTSCGIVGVVDSACQEIKKSSEDKREIGRTLLDMADAGRVGEGMTVEKVQAEGFKFFIDGTKLVADNPQCFSEQEVKTANSLLGR